MPESNDLFGDAGWYPHRYDAQNKRVLFARLDRQQIRGLTFLADHKPADSDQAWISAADLAKLDTSTIPAAPLHFVFHSAFVRSTLLTKALDVPGSVLGLSEPAILNDLAYAPQDAQQLLSKVLALLGRPFGEAEAVVVKPSNTANGLIPAMMTDRPQAKAILLTGSVTNFLRSVHKKGMFGRRWGRRLYSHVMQFAPLDLGMSDSDKFEATDLQYAGLAWFLQQRHFAMLLDGGIGNRMRSLESDAFNKSRGQTLTAIDQLMGLGMGDAAIAEMVAGPVFTTHSKGGGDIGERLEAEAKAADSAVVEEEIAMVAQWIGQIGQQAGVGGLTRPLF